MKLKTIFALPLAAAMLLTGGAAMASAEPDPGTKGEQIQLIVSSLSVWKPARKGDYVLTDLDGNGRYEITTARVTKKQVTELHTWEVDETGAFLRPVAEPWGDGDSEPDIRRSAADVYIDPDTGARWYIFEDVQQTDDGETTDLVALSLQNGAFVTELLAVKTADGCQNADREPIDPAAFESAANERFAAMEKQTASFNWIDTNEHPLDGAPMEQILELAEESLAGFRLEALSDASGEASGEASGSGEAS